MLDEAVGRFNSAATELQKTEFRRPSTPGEWQQMAKQVPSRDYAHLFSAVIPLIQAFEAAVPSDRACVALKLKPDALHLLRTFASFIPALAVRRASPALIAQGLTALAILGDVEDIRDLTFYLATLHYSAVRLRIDTPRLFDEIAGLATSTQLQSEMRRFPSRPPKDRDLTAFGFRETVTQEGFDLVQETEWACLLRDGVNR
jgi:hypothetical protein